MRAFLAGFSCLVILLCCGFLVGCSGVVKPPVAGATPAGKSSVPAAIAGVRTNTEAAMRAQLQQAANAAAMVEAAQSANTNQPASPFTDFVNNELGLAKKNLPPPDPVAALDAEKRRTATLAGRFEEAALLYRQASQDAETLRKEVETLRGRATASQFALEQAEAAHAATLARNQAENQAKLDDAEARVKKAEDDRKNAELREQVKWLRIIGICCLLAAIGIGVATNGMQIVKSAVFGGFALLCFGLAQIVAHPWFMPAVVIAVVCAVGCGIYWLVVERRGATTRDGYQRTIAALERTKALDLRVDDKHGNPSTLAAELEKDLDEPQKLIVKRFRTRIKERAVRA